MDHQHPSSSSLSTKQEEMDKIDDGAEDEMLKNGSTSADKNEMEVEMKSFIDELPPEILMMILDYLDKRQLVKCRLLSSRCNEICCLLLEKKAKNDLYSNYANFIVQIRKPRRKNYLECKTIIKTSLDDFLKCFSPSEPDKSGSSGSSSDCRHRPCPFTRFKLQNLKYMTTTQMFDFVSSFGPHLKSIIFDIREEDVGNFEKLWRLFLHFAPNIEHLVILGDSSLAKVKLVDPITQFIAKLDPNRNFHFKSKSMHPDPAGTFLNNLKVLEIKATRFDQVMGFVTDLVESVPNIIEISAEHPDLYYNKELKNLQVLQQLGKLHLVKTLDMKSSARSDIPPADLMKNLRLVKLVAGCTGYSKSDVKGNEIISGNVYHAMKFSQETLTNLRLTGLTLESVNRCFRDIKSLPSVRQLELQINHAVEIAPILNQLSKLCPKITTLYPENLERNFEQVVPIIWTGFKGLKTLHLSLTLNNADNGKCHPSILDSAFSGYSTESIRRIQTKLEAGISLEEARANEQQNPSIFDLKDLVELQLRIDLDDAECCELEEQVRDSLLMKILPEYLTKNPTLLEFSHYCQREDSDDDDSIHRFHSNSDSDSVSACGCFHGLCNGH